MTNKEAVKVVREAFSALAQLCSKHNDAAERALWKSEACAKDGEKLHRRGVGGEYRESVEVCASYFACKWALEPKDGSPKDWADAASVRLDALYGYAVRDCFANDSKNAHRFEAWVALYRPAFEHIDYSVDLVWP